MNQSKTNLIVAGILLTSGLIHLALWLLSGQQWEGAVSLRKPALFGISSGVTLWSLGWVQSALQVQRAGGYWSLAIAWSLLLEVGLITLQYWRGVPSHFNHATTLDSWIEFSMLALILLVTIGIARLCLRTMGHVAHPPAMTLAIRAGMWLLLLSCVLGFVTTFAGKWNLMHGRPYEYWGRAGVLKFPHGVALHAIQLFPLYVWLLERWRLAEPYRAVLGLVCSQVVFMLVASWQTLQGRSRFDLDWIGATLLGVALLSALLPLLPLRRP